MNYRHIYHAGNPADVLKHIVLIELIKSLKQKEKPFCYLDTHAGIGRYDLFSNEAQKSREYEHGIMKLYEAVSIPEPLSDYFKIMKKINENQIFRYYPGSPYFAKSLLRNQDSMILNELHPRDHKMLKKEFKFDRQIHIHRREAYELLQALLPLKEKRGLIFIDPPYEKKSELTDLVQALHRSLQRFLHGTYFIWFPIKNQSGPAILKLFKKEFKLRILWIQWITGASAIDSANSDLKGSLLAIINPPWLIEKKIVALRPWILKIFKYEQTGSFELFAYD